VTAPALAGIVAASSSGRSLGGFRRLIRLFAGVVSSPLLTE
jgi:hypothetical protein